MTRLPPTGERTFKWLMFLMALSVLLLAFLLGLTLARGSRQAMNTFGWHFLLSTEWDPANEQFGALPFVFGTLLSSALAMLFAVPLGIGTAVYLTELAPRRLGQTLGVFVEVLAAIPSVVLGLWGAVVMVPWLREHLFPALHSVLGFLPFFGGPIYGVSILAGGLIIAIMTVPIVISVSREILSTVPESQREAAFALGATRWEMIRIAVLGYARKGLTGAAILGLGRALGETMAVTMVIGNRPEIAASLFAPGYTLTSVIANEFGEATADLYLSSLFEIGLVLLVLSILVNAVARLLLSTLAHPLPIKT